MTKNIANVDITTDNFAAWLAKTNQMLESFRHDVMTVSNTTVSVTTGNATLIGRFSSDILIANVALRGGNNSTSANLAVSSQLNVANTVKVQSIRVDNGTTNVFIQAPSAADQANASIFLHANGSWVHVNLTTFPGTANNSLHLGAIPAANYMHINGDYTVAGVHNHTANVALKGIIANGSIGLPGELLKSNGTSTYWEAVAGLALPGSNSWIVFNDSGDFGANVSYYFISANTTVVVGNSTVNTTMSNTEIKLSNSTVSSSLSRNQLLMGTSVVVNTVMITTGPTGLIANTTAALVGTNTTILSGSVLFGNTTANAYINSSSFSIANSVQSMTLDMTKLALGNSTANALVNSSLAVFANSTGTSNLTPFGLRAGASVVNALGVAVGANVIANTTAVYVGTATINAVMTQTQLALSNSTSNTKISIPTVAERANNSFLHANGSWVQVFGRTAIPVNAFSMIKQTTNGAALGTIETGNQNMHVTYDFDTSTQEHVQFQIPMPSGWDEGTISFQSVWSHPSTTTNFGVVWQLAAVAVSDAETMNVAFGTANTSVDTGGSTNTIYISPESGPITVGGTPSAGDLVMFRLSRVPANGSDNLAVDARLHAVRLFINISTMYDT